jgi:hypothetical protein
VRIFAASGEGPDIEIYRDPRQTQPFVSRAPRSVPDLEALDPSPSTGGEGQFYFDLGVNYESFGYLGAAILCYDRGIHFPGTDSRTFSLLAEHRAGCLDGVNRHADALSSLDNAARFAPDARAAAAIARFRNNLVLAHGPQGPSPAFPPATGR